MLKLALKLADEERCLFLAAHFKDAPNAHQNRPGHGGNSCGDSERKEEEELLAKTHCVSSSEAPAMSSEPSARNLRSRTLLPTAQARGRSSSGIRVFRSSTSCSARKSVAGSCIATGAFSPSPRKRMASESAGLAPT